MQKQVFVLLDSKSKVYSTPMFSINEQTMLRSMTDLANDPNTEPGRYPEDFSLWAIGWYDDLKGEIDYQPPQHVVNMIHLVHSDELDQHLEQQPQTLGEIHHG